MREDGFQLFKLWPVGGRAGNLLAEYLLASGRFQLGGLGAFRRVLVFELELELEAAFPRMAFVQLGDQFIAF